MITTVIFFICILIFLCFFYKRLSFFYIIKSQLESFYDFKKDKVDKKLCTLYFILPLVISFIIVKNIGLNKNILESATVIFSIFVGLLLNLLLLIYDLFQKTQCKDKKRFLKEIYSSITFSILISIIALIIITARKFNLTNIISNKTLIYLSLGSKTLICYVMFLFVINLFIILKRMHVLIDSDLEI